MSKYIIHEIREHLCEVCNKPIGDHKGYPYYFDKNKNTFYCPECALDAGFIDATEWLRYHGLGHFEKAEYKNGVITIYQKWGTGYTKSELVVNEVVQNE